MAAAARLIARISRHGVASAAVAGVARRRPEAASALATAEPFASMKSKKQEVKDMKDKVLRSYAEMENVLARTKRESENTKKYAIQNFSKNLLDVADNLSRASSAVKENFSKIDTSNNSDEAVLLLKTLLEGVEMTEKQLGEVFKKFGVEKFDPLNEKFDPNRHYALFQIPDPSKPSGTVAAVVKMGSSTVQETFNNRASENILRIL
ncbi:Protein GrpE [Dichanthelium oligosanthes]|uniref:Protein GrpE n=1 Tax=Dichanthelium oligosanthes TaxID=888268 RepID=A0A1E5ULB2_9POAL|nr:Protein GrpE [Dichanthelium oligosanthes]